MPIDMMSALNSRGKGAHTVATGIDASSTYSDASARQTYGCCGLKVGEKSDQENQHSDAPRIDTLRDHL